MPPIGVAAKTGAKWLSLGQATSSPKLLIPTTISCERTIHLSRLFVDTNRHRLRAGQAGPALARCVLRGESKAFAWYVLDVLGFWGGESLSAATPSLSATASSVKTAYLSRQGARPSGQ